MKKSYLLQAAGLLLLTLSLNTSCKQKTKPQAGQPLPEVVYSKEVAKEVSFVTTGNIYRNTVVKVIFNNPVINEDQIGSTVDKVFTFSPKIKGSATWSSTTTLEFQSEEDLPTRTVIKGSLDLQKLSPTFKEKELEDLTFYLNVLGRELNNVYGAVELKERNDPKHLIYRGGVSFSEATDLETLKANTTLKGGGKIDLTWSQLSESSFQFVSDDIVRTDKDVQYTLSIKGKALDLTEDHSESFVVSPLKEMKVNQFSTDENGRSPAIRITFSDELDIDQNIDGLISISPEVDFQVRKMGNALSIDGGFKFGSSYKITVQKGIRSRWATYTAEAKSEELQFSNIPPQLEFASNGIVLPSSNNKRLQFYTTNLKRVHLQVKKVQTNKIGQFLESSQLSSDRKRNKGFGDHYSGSIGVIVKNQTIELSDVKNEWLLNEIDLSELFDKYNDGLFLIRLNFNASDVSETIEGDLLSYLEEQGQIYKPVFLSNLGITAKYTNDETQVFVTDLLTGQPVSNARVSLLDYNGEVRTYTSTGDQGQAYFRDEDGAVYFNYITASKDKQISALNRDEMRWSTSGFDVGGIGENRMGLRGFIYTERGVYRPGDSIHIAFIARNEDDHFPADHPIDISVRDPEYDVVFEQTNVSANDGMYVFAMATDDDAPTGTYSVLIEAGGAYFRDELKIETVVAEQLRVTVRPDKRNFQWNDREIGFEVDARYLFGAPAPNLKAEIDIEVHPHTITFPKYADYHFSRVDVDYKPFTQNVSKTTLNEEGQLKGSWFVPPLGNVPSALKLKISAKVLEKGGQPNQGWNIANYHVYPAYVGIKDPSGYGYYQTGAEAKFPVVLLDPDGNKVTNRQLQYRIYRNDRRWWYQYNDRRSYQLKYKEDSQTYIASEGSISLGEGSTHIGFVPAQNGEYLIEVMDGGNGHTASMFFSAYQYGSVPGGDMNEGTLSMRSDKAVYSSSETARILIPNPKQGKVLVTVERGNSMLDWFWADPTKEKGDEMIINIPLHKRYLPNIYVTVSVLQPHNQTTNDRPIRMFGIMPLRIEDPDTRIHFDLETPGNLVPNEDFEVNISTRNGKPAQFTIAVVDEGLLSLTQFRTPDPWRQFYKKIGLYVETYDLFSHIISANRDDVFQTFSIGGADEMDYREAQLDPVDGKKRFEPVSMFRGPLNTNSQGKATVKFHMPNYNGAVRIMVIGSKAGSYGHAEKTVPVRSDIIMQTNLPRILKPTDEFEVPVSLFNMTNTEKEAQFTISTTGPLEVVGNHSTKVTFGADNQALIKFKIRAKNQIGQGSIVIDGTAGKVQVQNKTNLQVVPSASRLFDKQTQRIEKGATIKMKVPQVGLEGTNNASLNISLFPNMDFDHRLRWLIRYPYGCLEQTTSALFPQLYLKKMGYFSSSEQTEIDNNLNAGIGRLQQFLLQGGGFAYWPGNTNLCEWSSNYATHFLVEAKKMGYSVPDYLYNNAIGGLEKLARRNQGELSTRAYRAFILALAERQVMAEMNLLMENELDQLNNASRWMLAAAYHQAGAENIRDRILESTGTQTTEYEPFSYNFGSSQRDDAIILYCATLMQQNETAQLVAESVATTLSGKDYLSTQSSGYMLLALGKYFDASNISVSGDQIITGHVLLANGQKIEFNKKGSTSLRLYNNFNKDIEIHLAPGSSAEQIFASLSWNGVPIKDTQEPVAKNIQLEVTWYNQNGLPINPAKLKQGETFYGRFSVHNTSSLSRVSEMALMQILPSGWQIENTRLNSTALPEWTNSWNLNKENYLDIRDDRIMWFFDLENSTALDFVVKLNCVTAGKYWLPGTLVEAMYNNNYKASTSGKDVYVEAFE